MFMFQFKDINDSNHIVFIMDVSADEAAEKLRAANPSVEIWELIGKYEQGFPMPVIME